MASAAGVRAEDVTVQGSPGTSGASGVNPGDPGQPGFAAPPTFAAAESSDPINRATAIGGTGGYGGSIGDYLNNELVGNEAAVGGTGGDATATAASSGEADAISVGGTGGGGGGSNSFAAAGGSGGSASSVATASSLSGNGTASAVATGGDGGTSGGEGPDSNGGDANASSSASTGGSGDASATANATGGATGVGDAGTPATPGNATATADAAASGDGKAIATAVATQGYPSSFDPFHIRPTTANATSSAATVNGAMAEASSTADGTVGEAQSTATTSLRGASVRSTVMAPASSSFSGFGPASSVALAQSGSAPFPGPSFPGGEAYSISTVLPDENYVTTLIDSLGGASNVGDLLLGSRDEIFGTAYQFGGQAGTISTTWDFHFQGDLLLGVIYDGGFDIIANGIDIPFEDAGGNSVIDLGFLGPNIDLTIEGEGVFAFGGAVPESSTWALMLLGFAGLGFAGYRSTGGARPRRQGSFSRRPARQTFIS